MHHVFLSPVAWLAAAVFSSSQVAGASPCQTPVLYQIRPFTAPLVKMPASLPSGAWPRAAKPGGVAASYAAKSTKSRGWSTPSAYHCCIRPGPGRPATSGRLPPAMAVVSAPARSRWPV